MERFIQKISKLGFTIGAISIVPYSCLYDVDGGERAVMFNRFAGGISDTIIGEGSHFYIPWFQTPYLYDIKTKPKVINTTTGTRGRHYCSFRFANG